jgi:hypothetical protein
MLTPVYRPETGIELAVAQSVLEANGIPYFVHNAGFASLYPGLQLDLLNVRTIMVPTSASEAAVEVLSEYLPRSSGLRPGVERSVWHILRLLVEAICCAWFVPRVGHSVATKHEP